MHCCLSIPHNAKKCRILHRQQSISIPKLGSCTNSCLTATKFRNIARASQMPKLTYWALQLLYQQQSKLSRNRLGTLTRGGKAIEKHIQVPWKGNKEHHPGTKTWYTRHNRPLNSCITLQVTRSICSDRVKKKRDSQGT